MKWKMSNAERESAAAEQEQRVRRAQDREWWRSIANAAGGGSGPNSGGACRPPEQPIPAQPEESEHEILHRNAT